MPLQTLKGRTKKLQQRRMEEGRPSQYIARPPWTCRYLSWLCLKFRIMGAVQSQSTEWPRDEDLQGEGQGGSVQIFSPCPTGVWIGTNLHHSMHTPLARVATISSYVFLFHIAC